MLKMKISLPFCLLFLLFLATNTKKLAAKNRGICQEGLGLCGSDCDERCKARHNAADNPHGSCNRIGNAGLCDCLYGCVESPPRLLTGSNVCNEGLGECSFLCNLDCCKVKCLSLHNGGQGYCDTNLGISLCQCSYPCSDN